MNPAWQIIQSVAVLATIFCFFVLVYDVFTTEAHKSQHKARLEDVFQRLQRIRPLTLAQEDAAWLLSALNKLYGSPKRVSSDSSQSFSFKSRDVWLWRPVLVSFIIAFAYVVPLSIFSLWRLEQYAAARLGVPPSLESFFDSALRYAVFWVPVNAALDLLSVNVSRKLLDLMTRSTSLLLLGALVLADLVLAVLFYFTGPVWWTIDYLLGPRPLSALDIELLPYRLSVVSEIFQHAVYVLSHPISAVATGMRSARNTVQANVVIMYFTTVIPTALHFAITVAFFGSKVFAQPLRILTERSMSYMIKLPRGIAGLLALAATALLVGAIWILGRQ